MFSKNEINRLPSRLISFFEKMEETCSKVFKFQYSALKAGVHAEKIMKIDLEMAEIIDPKVGNPLKKETKSAIKMILSKFSLSHVWFCN